MTQKSLLSLLSVLLFSTFSFAQIEFKPTTWQETLELAEKENKLIFFDAYTTWCGPCKLMEKRIFTEPEVAEYFNTHFINFKQDMEEGVGIELAEDFDIMAYPTLLFYDPTTKSIKSQLIGYQKKESLIEWAKSVL